MGVNELVLGAPWVVGGGGIVGGVSLDCVFTSTGESGIVECFSMRSVTYMTFLFSILTVLEKKTLLRKRMDYSKELTNSMQHFSGTQIC